MPKNFYAKMKDGTQLWVMPAVDTPWDVEIRPNGLECEIDMSNVEEIREWFTASVPTA